MFLDVTIIGRLGRDPDMRYLPNGTPVCKFSVATDRWRADKNANETTWINVTAWAKLAETCNEHLAKGKLVLVKGSQIRANAWKGKDGEARASLELTAQMIKFLSPKGESQDNASLHPEYKDDDEVSDIVEEDIPF